jgi:hypothetical protein
MHMMYRLLVLPDVDTTVSVHFDFEGVTTSYSVIAGPDGLFEYTLTDPVAVVGTIITAVASDAAGNICCF